MWACVLCAVFYVLSTATDNLYIFVRINFSFRFLEMALIKQ